MLETLISFLLAGAATASLAVISGSITHGLAHAVRIAAEMEQALLGPERCAGAG